MREKYESLALVQLKELAKSQGIKNISGLRKAELIDRLCETAEGADRKKAAAGNSENRESTAVPAQGTAVEAAASGNVQTDSFHAGHRQKEDEDQRSKSSKDRV